MKKLLIIIIALMSVLNMNAYGYYNEYSYGYTTLERVILFVVAIANICLFFKVWGMANNMQRIREHLRPKNNNDTNIVNSIKENMVLGDKDALKRIFVKKFIEQINVKASNSSITPQIKTLIKQYAKIDEQVPQKILDLKTAEDFWNLFTHRELYN